MCFSSKVDKNNTNFQLQKLDKTKITDSIKYTSYAGTVDHFGATAAPTVGRCRGDVGGTPGALPSRADPTWRTQQTVLP